MVRPASDPARSSRSAACSRSPTPAPSSAIVDQLIAANPARSPQVKDKPQAFGWFVGQVMKATGGKANPGVVNEILEAKLAALG